MTTQTARICIIGAGISGITAGKFLKEKGLGYDCFEASSVLGGNWAVPRALHRSCRRLSLNSNVITLIEV